MFCSFIAVQHPSSSLTVALIVFDYFADNKVNRLFV